MQELTFNIRSSRVRLYLFIYNIYIYTEPQKKRYIVDI